jgi:hypothetical protein
MSIATRPPAIRRWPANAMSVSFGDDFANPATISGVLQADP